jgi:molybdopterin molybdotransferase
VLALARLLPPVDTRVLALGEACGTILAAPVIVDADLPPFSRATMDGFAVAAASTFGASEANPAYLTVAGTVAMGEPPGFAVESGRAARIATGGMLPVGTDAVVMIEQVGVLDESTIEVYRSLAPGQNAVLAGEDFAEGQVALTPGTRLRPQEIGLLAALGVTQVRVHRRPVVAVMSTGDEIVPVHATPGPGKIRDINAFALAARAGQAGAATIDFGIIGDNPDHLDTACRKALEQSDMVLVSGGSSMGSRDYTIEVLAGLPQAEILVHGIAISPGKPTILARCGDKAVWGLPGHPVSAMVVMEVVVRAFIERIAGLDNARHFSVAARFSRNLASAQGRVDVVRVRLVPGADGTLWAEPILGKSGLIHTLVEADGLVEIGLHCEGLEKGERVEVRLL